MSYEYKISIINETEINEVIKNIYKAFRKTELLKNVQFEDGIIKVPDFWMNLCEEDSREIYYSINASGKDRAEVVKTISNVLTRMKLEFVYEEE